MDQNPKSAGAWPTSIFAITLFQEDLAAAKQFYHEVFGLPVVFEDADSGLEAAHCAGMLATDVRPFIGERVLR